MAGSIIITTELDDNGLIERLEMFKGQFPYGLLPAWVKIANRLEIEEMAMAPVRTGHLRSNIQTAARVMGVDSWSDAWDKGYNYARINHDGGYASGMYGPHYIRGKKYMEIPVNASPSYALPILSDRIDELIALCGL